jgi:hypothetical protein
VANNTEGRRQRAQRLLVVVVLALVAAVQGEWSAEAQEPDPVVGTWELNLSKSSYNPGPPPRSETRVMVQDGDVIRATSKGIDAAGQPVGAVWTITYDGREHRIAGGTDADSQRLVRLDRWTTEATLTRGGTVIQTARREISRDGKTMTLTFTGSNVRGQPVHNVMVFDRRR